jgi:hypothetical protein
MLSYRHTDTLTDANRSWAYMLHKVLMKNLTSGPFTRLLCRQRWSDVFFMIAVFCILQRIYPQANIEYV